MPGKETREPILPGVGGRVSLPDVPARGIHLRLQALEKRVAALEAVSHVKLYHKKFGYKDFSDMVGAGAHQLPIFAAPAGCEILTVYAWVSEAFLAQGTPRSGFSSLTNLMFSVGTKTDPDSLLIQKDGYNATPNWAASTDKGVDMNSDARKDVTSSFTDEINFWLEVTPTPADGDYTLLYAGQIEVIFVTTL